MRVSALSLNKKQSSTYSKYACGCFLYAPSIYSAYLQKANGRLFSKSLVQQRHGCHRSEMSVRGHFWASSFSLEKLVTVETTDILSAAVIFWHKAKLVFPIDTDIYRTTHLNIIGCTGFVFYQYIKTDGFCTGRISCNTILGRYFSSVI